MITDFSEPLLECMRANAARNPGAVEVSLLNWDDQHQRQLDREQEQASRRGRAAAEEGGAEDAEEFDLIIAADVVYNPVRCAGVACAVALPAADPPEPSSAS